jgi:hypothetical protein
MNYLVPLKKTGFANSDEAKAHFAGKVGRDPEPDELSTLMEKNPILDYGDVLKQIVKSPAPVTPNGPGGFDEDTMRKAVSVMNAIDDAKAGEATAFQVSEDTYRWLRGKVLTFRYAMAHQSILEFMEDIRNAPRAAEASERKQ